MPFGWQRTGPDGQQDPSMVGGGFRELAPACSVLLLLADQRSQGTPVGAPALGQSAASASATCGSAAPGTLLGRGPA